MVQVTVADFLTDQQIEQCLKLEKAKLICEQVTSPNLLEINRKLGQENDPMYLAFCIEYAINRSKNQQGS